MAYLTKQLTNGSITFDVPIASNFTNNTGFISKSRYTDSDVEKPDDYFLINNGARLINSIEINWGSSYYTGVIDNYPTNIYNSIDLIQYIYHLEYLQKIYDIRLTEIESDIDFIDYESSPLSIKSLENNNEIIWKTNNSEFVKTIEVSTDNGETWTSYVSSVEGTKLATLNSGQKLLIRGNNTTYSDNTNYCSFGSTRKFIVYGNVLSLLTNNTLGQYSFLGLFKDCDKLISIKHLIFPNTTSYGCYKMMFMNCVSIITPPELPATTLTNSCYMQMFEGCTILQKSPILNATTLVMSCYNMMFKNCAALSRIDMYATDISANNCLQNWVQGVAKEGTFVKNTATTIERGVNGIPEGWTIKGTYEEMYFTLESLVDNNTFTLTIDKDNYGDSLDVTTISYSTDDGVTWTTVNRTPNAVTTITVPNIGQNEKVLWKGISTKLYAASGPGIYSKFSATGDFNAYGNISSLSNSDNFLVENPDNKVYGGLFKGNPYLKNAENLILPATTLAEDCYSSMFYGCLSLTTAPQLPATILAEDCYSSMFYGCSSLTTAPQLPATYLVEWCYNSMFYGCSSLSYIKMLATDISATSCLINWVEGVSSTGTFIKAPEANIDRGISGIPENWIVENDYDYSQDYLTIESLENGNVITWKANNVSFIREIYASIDNGATWSNAISSSTDGSYIASLSTGQKLLIKGSNDSYGNSSYYNYFTSTGKFNVYGNIMSLTEGDNFINKTELRGTYTFEYLFYNCKKLNSAKHLVLPATELKQNCYASMFRECNNLLTPPVELPAITLENSCYIYMFSGCNNLENTPILYAKVLAQSCYSYMFRACKKLLTAPELNVMKVEKSCYSNMFNGCTALINPPYQLPAMELEQYCYSAMFGDCTSLQTSPILPANNLVSSCYSTMFKNCTSLNYITMLATNISASNCLQNWVQGVSQTGTFIKSTALSNQQIYDSGIPSTWTIVTE